MDSGWVAAGTLGAGGIPVPRCRGARRNKHSLTHSFVGKTGIYKLSVLEGEENIRST